MGESMNRIFLTDEGTKRTVDADKLIHRLEKLRDAVPEGAQMRMSGIVNVIIEIIKAESEIYEAERGRSK